MTNSALIKKIGAAAVKLYPKHKILPSLTIAQAILESGWGKSELSKKHHNYFGMKWVEGCGTKYVTFKTNEQRPDGSYYTISARFRKYASLQKGIEGYYVFLQYPRYANLKGVTDYKTACRLIREDGWATSLSYEQLLVTLIEQFSLTDYDKKVISKTESAPKKKKATLKIGSKVKVNGYIFWGGNGGNKIKKKNATMYIVDIVNANDYKYPYGVAATKGGVRQGWTNKKSLKLV